MSFPVGGGSNVPTAGVPSDAFVGRPWPAIRTADGVRVRPSEFNERQMMP